MASYPSTIKPGKKYVGTFPEIRNPFTVTMNGGTAPYSVTPLPGGGFEVVIEGADVVCPDQGDGSIVVADATHSFTTIIDC